MAAAEFATAADALRDATDETVLLVARGIAARGGYALAERAVVGLLEAASAREDKPLAAKLARALRSITRDWQAVLEVAPLPKLSDKGEAGMQQALHTARGMTRQQLLEGARLSEQLQSDVSAVDSTRFLRAYAKAHGEAQIAERLAWVLGELGPAMPAELARLPAPLSSGSGALQPEGIG